MDFIEEMLNDEEVVGKYRSIDETNHTPSSHGMRHIMGVVDLAERIGKIFGFSEREILILKTIEVLHDIGQVGGVRAGHWFKSADFAREYLPSKNIFTEEELEMIYSAISTHDEFLDYSKFENKYSWFTALIDKLVPAIKEAMNMPVYKKDETAGMSIERILEAYGVTIPDSRYYDMLDVAVTVYEAHVAGDENYPAYSKEVVLASKGIGAMLIHILKDVTAKEYTQAIEFVCKLLGVDVPANLIGYAGDAIDRFEGIELVVSTAILPLILKVSVDDAPADCNVTLPGYAELIEAPEAEKTFWEKIQDFFIKIFEFVMSLFAFI